MRRGCWITHSYVIHGVGYRRNTIESDQKKIVQKSQQSTVHSGNRQRFDDDLQIRKYGCVVARRM